MMKSNEYEYVFNLTNEVGNVEEYIFMIEKNENPKL